MLHILKLYARVSEKCLVIPSFLSLRTQTYFLLSLLSTRVERSDDWNLSFSPPQRLPLRIPIKIAKIEKIESARGTIVPAPSLFLSPQPARNTKRPLRRREFLSQKHSIVPTQNYFFIHVSINRAEHLCQGTVITKPDCNRVLLNQ